MYGKVRNMYTGRRTVVMRVDILFWIELKSISSTQYEIVNIFSPKNIRQISSGSLYLLIPNLASLYYCGIVFTDVQKTYFA
jgi:hypothetical protein